MPVTTKYIFKRCCQEQGLDVEQMGCELCGIRNAIFDIHHIVFKSEIPKHPEVNNCRNLIFVCRECHILLHTHKRDRDSLIKERELEKLFNKKFVYDTRNCGKESN